MQAGGHVLRNELTGHCFGPGDASDDEGGALAVPCDQASAASPQWQLRVPEYKGAEASQVTVTLQL